MGLALLYVGISPKPPSAVGTPSRQTLRSRLRYHFRGNAEGSTLRLSLGCLLSQSLGIELRRVGSGRRMTFGAGERVLSDWLERNARVAWLACDEPWRIEEAHDPFCFTAAELGPESAPRVSLGACGETACGESASKRAAGCLTQAAFRDSSLSDSVLFGPDYILDFLRRHSHERARACEQPLLLHLQSHIPRPTLFTQ